MNAILALLPAIVTTIAVAAVALLARIFFRDTDDEDRLL